MSHDKPPWCYSSPDDGSAFPEHLVDMVWSYVTHAPFHAGCIKPHSKEVLGKLVNKAFAASLQSEEGRPVRLQLVFDVKPRQVTTTFDDPLDYTDNNLVKLAPTIDIGFRWVVVAPEQPGSDTLKIIGISDPELSQLASNPMRVLGGGLMSHQPNLEGMKLSVFGPGCVRIETSMEVFELRDCCIRFPFSVSTIRYVREWYEEAGQCPDFSALPVDSVVEDAVHWQFRRQADAQQLVRRTWGSILSKVCNARHGGTFLVVPNDVVLSTLVRFKYPQKSDRLQAAVQKRASFEPGLSNPHYRRSMAGADLDDAHFSERDLARMSDYVASFAAVDGAVVLQRDLTLLGFGAEIVDTKLPKEHELVEYGKHPHGKPDDKRLTSFGMRHRSACRFCQNVEGAIAFVVSQDGGVYVFCNIGEKTTAFQGSTPEDWVGGMIRVVETHEQGRPKTQEQEASHGVEHTNDT